MRLTIFLAVVALVMAAFVFASPDGANAGASDDHTCADNAVTNETDGVWAYVSSTGDVDPYGGIDELTFPPNSGFTAICIVPVSGASVLFTVASETACYKYAVDTLGYDHVGWRIGTSPPGGSCQEIDHIDFLLAGQSTLKQGDVSCDNLVNAADALLIQRYSAQLSVTQNEPCPNIGIDWADSFAFGDVDCSGTINSVDSLKIQRYAASLPYEQNEPCDNIGIAMTW